MKYSNNSEVALSEVEGKAYNEKYWREFYAHNKVSGGSPFAEYVVRQFGDDTLVVEIGCGSGRDSVYFGTKNFFVWAGDICPEGIQQATSTKNEIGLDKVFFSIVDASSAEEMGNFLKSDELHELIKTKKNLVVYMRFFLHSVTEEIESNILRSLASAFPVGFYLCVEFRTDKDENLSKIYGGHYRRYINEENFLEKLKTFFDFKLEHLEVGTGLSPYKEEDPHLARIILQKI